MRNQLISKTKTKTHGRRTGDRSRPARAGTPPLFTAHTFFQAQQRQETKRVYVMIRCRPTPLTNHHSPQITYNQDNLQYICSSPIILEQTSGPVVYRTPCRPPPSKRNHSTPHPARTRKSGSHPYPSQPGLMTVFRPAPPLQFRDARSHL